MTVKEIEKILLNDGWVLRKCKGSHRQYIHSEKSGKVTIPWHKGDVPIWLAKSIMKQAGLN